MILLGAASTLLIFVEVVREANIKMPIRKIPAVKMAEQASFLFIMLSPIKFRPLIFQHKRDDVERRRGAATKVIRPQSWVDIQNFPEKERNQRLDLQL